MLDENRKYDALPVVATPEGQLKCSDTQARKQPKPFPHRLFIIRNNCPFCKGCFSRIKRPGLAYFSSVADDGSALEVRCFFISFGGSACRLSHEKQPPVRCSVFTGSFPFFGKGPFFILLFCFQGYHGQGFTQGSQYF